MAFYQISELTAMRGNERSRDRVHHCKFLSKQQFLLVVFDKNKKEIWLQLSVLSHSNPSIYQAIIMDKNIPPALEAVCQNSLEAIFKEIEEGKSSDMRFFLNAENEKIGIAIEVELFGKEVKKDVYLETVVFQPIHTNQIEARLQEMLRIQRENFQTQIKRQREEFQKLVQKDRDNNDYIMHLSNIKRYLERSLKEMDGNRKSEMAALQKQLDEERRLRRQDGQSITRRLQLLQKGFNQRLKQTPQIVDRQIRVNTLQIVPKMFEVIPSSLSSTSSGSQPQLFITRSYQKPSPKIINRKQSQWSINKTASKCLVLRNKEELSKRVRESLKKIGDEEQMNYTVKINFNQDLQDEQPYRFYVGLALRQELENLQRLQNCPDPLQSLKSIIGVSYLRQQISIILNGRVISHNQTMKTINQVTLKFNYQNKQGTTMLKSFKVVANQRESDQYPTQTSKEVPNRSAEEYIPFIYFLDSFIQYNIEKS